MSGMRNVLRDGKLLVYESEDLLVSGGHPDYVKDVVAENRRPKQVVKQEVKQLKFVDGFTVPSDMAIENELRQEDAAIEQLLSKKEEKVDKEDLKDLIREVLGEFINEKAQTEPRASVPAERKQKKARKKA